MKRKNINLRKFFTASIILMIIILFLLSLNACTQKVSLYFAIYTDTDANLAEEIREITAGKEFYKNIIEELIKGPESNNLYPTIPSNVEVYSVEISDSTATVDFSKEIITNFYTLSCKKLLDFIVSLQPYIYWEKAPA